MDSDKVYYYQPYMVKTVAGLLSVIIFLQVAAVKDWTGVTLGEKTIIILLSGYAAIFGIVWITEGLTYAASLIPDLLKESKWFNDLVSRWKSPK